MLKVKDRVVVLVWIEMVGRMQRVLHIPAATFILREESAVQEVRSLPVSALRQTEVLVPRKPSLLPNRVTELDPVLGVLEGVKLEATARSKVRRSEREEICLVRVSPTDCIVQTPGETFARTELSEVQGLAIAAENPGS